MANKNGWTTFKKLRSLAASMKTVSEENHQRGSFAETKITGCHDSMLLQLGNKMLKLWQKKTFHASRSHKPVRVRILGQINMCVVGVLAFCPPIPPQAVMAPCLCSISCSSTRNKAEYFSEGINSSLSGGKRVFPNLCPVM